MVDRVKPSCCFYCENMGTDVSGQVPICMESNIGKIDKKQVDEMSMPKWCPVYKEKQIENDLDSYVSGCVDGSKDGCQMLLRVLLDKAGKQVVRTDRGDYIQCLLLKDIEEIAKKYDCYE
jgi:hypothetical protein